MPRTIRVKIYKFSELTEHNQKKVLEKYYDINVDYNWWESTYDDAEQIGLKINEFSVDFDRPKWAKGEFQLSPHEVAANIIRDHGNECETYKTTQTFLDTVNEIQGKYEELEGEDYENEMIEIEDEFLNFLLNDYVDILIKEYEYLTTDKQIIETIEANDIEFLEDGTVFNVIKFGGTKK
jgi:hypothetical protein